MTNVIPPDRETVFGLKIRRDRLARFKEVAGANHRTITQQLRSMIDREIAEFDREQEEAA